ncbi:hypothetical protein FGO68_gene973 [Halteria grandinella]|uniref:Uncharacterized protein n=1 Tax=Halteria grandinella TaxID=5974 RepID=A0A8J8NXJ6_HALGN|nr:hypothetical protein FGO68_gene973 [Halteria grandinella]
MQKQSQYRAPFNFSSVESGSDLHISYPHTSILQTIQESDHQVNRSIPLIKRSTLLQDHRASQPTQSTQSTSIMHHKVVTDKMQRLKQYTSEVETDELDEEMARRISLDTTIVYKDSRNARVGGGSTLLMRVATKQNESSRNSLPQLARRHTNSQMKEGSLAVFQNLRRSLAPTLGAYSSIDLKPVKSNNGLTPYKPAFNPLNNSVDYGSFEVNSPPQNAQLQQLRPSASILSKYEEPTPLKESLLQFNHQSQPAINGGNVSHSSSPKSRSNLGFIHNTTLDDGTSSQNSSQFKLRVRKLNRSENHRNSLGSLQMNRQIGLKMKEIVISHASKFASLHKELSQDTLSTLLLPKDTLTDLDFERHRYFDQALRLHTDCVRFIALKNQDKSLESLRLLEEFASLAYDVALLREVLALQALTCCLYGQWESARGYYQKLVDLGGEARLVEDRKIGYKGMARCYQEGKNYKVAIRCYKKLLECAWDSNDYESEVAAFEGLAQQYYYLGDLKRAGFYLDRMQRGKVERKDSKVREMYLSQLNHKRSLKEKNQVSFAQLNSFNSLYDSLTASPGKLGNLSFSTLTTITKKLKNRAKQASSKLQSDFKPKSIPNQPLPYTLAGVPIYFRNAFTKERRPLLIRPGTAISRAPSNDFPSPRVGGNGSGQANYELLPHFCEGMGDGGNGVQVRKRRGMGVQATHSLTNNRDDLSAASFTGARARLPAEEEQSRLLNMHWRFDMKEIVRKAIQSRSSGRGGTTIADINITHLNPLKCQKAFKAGFEYKQRAVGVKMGEVEALIQKQIKLVENDAVPVEEISDEQFAQIIGQIRNRQVASSAFKAGQIECLAYVSNPLNFKLKKYNEKLNQALAQVQNDSIAPPLTTANISQFMK